jgi:hypothetical protein
MVFNRPARMLLAAVREDATVVSHDWLAYLLVAGCDGRIFYDLIPTIDYRQHDRNVVGTNIGLRGRLNRLHKMLKGILLEWNDNNILALHPIVPLFTEQNRNRFHRFCHARAGGMGARTRVLLESDVYHQTFLGNVGLFVAALLGKM